MSLPLIVIMLAVVLIVAPFEDGFDYVRLIVGYLGVVLGLSLFLIGLDISILPIGESVGKNLHKFKKPVFIILFGVMFGFIATIAEPAMWVLARQTDILLPIINETVFVFVMSAGIGAFVGLALWKIIKGFNIKWLILISYLVVFALVIFTPAEFIGLAFDGSGATTGDISVPFMLALGLGCALTLSRRGARGERPATSAERPATSDQRLATSDKGTATSDEATKSIAKDSNITDTESVVNDSHHSSLIPVPSQKPSPDTFGMIGIASIGPIIAIFIYGIVIVALSGGNLEIGVYDPGALEPNILDIILTNLLATSIAIVPIIAVFLPMQFFIIKLSGKQFKMVMLGIIPVFLGLLIFLAALDFGFAFAGAYIGEVFLDTSRPDFFKWLLVIVAFILGVSITLSEPAVTVLGEQLANVTNGQISSLKIKIILALSIGVACILAVVKILLQINILWFLVPLYAVALLLMLFNTKLFVGLAFDSGGVVGGALTSALLTPMFLGIAQAVGYIEGTPEAVLLNGFGIIALISVTPLIAVQLLGLRGRSKGTGTSDD